MSRVFVSRLVLGVVCSRVPPLISSVVQCRD